MPTFTFTWRTPTSNSISIQNYFWFHSVKASLFYPPSLYHKHLWTSHDKSGISYPFLFVIAACNFLDHKNSTIPCVLGWEGHTYYIYLTTSRGEFFCVLLTLSLQLYLCNLQPPRVLDISTFIIPFLRWRPKAWKWIFLSRLKCH